MDPYNETVRANFFDPQHAGSLRDRFPNARHAEVIDAASGAHLVLEMTVDAGTIDALRFRARACPHLLAAAEWVCDEFEGRPVADLEQFEQNELMELLSVPVEKTGRMLILEDALQSLAKQYADGN